MPPTWSAGTGRPRWAWPVDGARAIWRGSAWQTKRWPRRGRGEGGGGAAAGVPAAGLVPRSQRMSRRTLLKAAATVALGAAGAGLSACADEGDELTAAPTSAATATDVTGQAPRPEA